MSVNNFNLCWSMSSTSHLKILMRFKQGKVWYNPPIINNHPFWEGRNAQISLIFMAMIIWGQHIRAYITNASWFEFEFWSDVWPSMVTHTILGVHLDGTSHLSRGIEGGESAGHSLPPWQFLPDSRLEPATSGYKSNALSIRPRLPLYLSLSIPS